MSELKQSKSKNIIISSLGLIIFVFIILVGYGNIHFFNDDEMTYMFKEIVTRILGGSLFVILIVGIRFKVLNPIRRPFLKSLIIISPAILISLYNFPLVPYLKGTAVITESTSKVLVFALECLSVGFFEEIVFRGFLLLLVIQLFPKTKKGIFTAMVIASSIFGLVHIVNLFSGANPLDTFLQIGYSFLMGLLWSTVLIKTKNIWFVISLHALYNFCGLIFFRLGNITGNVNIISITTTILIAAFVGNYMLNVFRKMEDHEFDVLYFPEKSTLLKEEGV